MSIEAIKERLLSTVGIGVAVARASDLGIVFCNAVFGDWFEGAAGGADLAVAVASLDVDAMRAGLVEGHPYAQEVSFKRRRRTLVIALTIAASGDEDDLLVIEATNVTRLRELEAMIDSYARMVERNTRELEREKERAEKLLLNIMPREAYEEFKTYGVVTPQLYDDVSILMLDFVGFTKFSAENDPTVTLSELNEIFTAFDRITEQFGCERIKTIGDAYLAVSGMPSPNPDHAQLVARCAVRFVQYLERRNRSHRFTWHARVGLAKGKAVGSVVGIQRYVYDVFGPAVNMAARLQTLAEPMTVLAHASMRDDLIDEFKLNDFGTHEIRGFGPEPLLQVAPIHGTTSI
ncbi:MAG: adenylate/guanylate cyclase domain-containing protein [Pseudomonadota bacterium]